ncbi:uncharacterized protein LOC143266070 isoform X2 [Megachile rotundata]|uniref:uncharacterized protein LOC143266070 isoform X2 n=1 Tax=Megachile rotundata TaxID=143995 RepID=UPI003FCEFAD6
MDLGAVNCSDVPAEITWFVLFRIATKFSSESSHFLCKKYKYKALEVMDVITKLRPRISALFFKNLMSFVK